MIIETTAACGQTPRILFLLEELGAPYEVQLHPEGHFLQKYGRPGPRLLDGDLTLFNGNTILRHLARSLGDGRMIAGGARELCAVDGWVDLSGALGWTIVQLLSEERASAEERRPARVAQERVKIDGLLAIVERGLDDSDGDWLAGDFGLSDCAFGSLPRLGRLVDLAKRPRLQAYAERLMQRPALTRALARLAGPDVPLASSEEVLSFWFGAPASSEAELMSKVQRWFRGGLALDAEIKARFATTVEAALAGKLDTWAETARGRLALVLLLDQFTRNLFRGDPRTHAGDQKAQRLALQAFESGTDGSLGHLERLFLSMPFAHAEDLSLSKRGAEIARQLASAAPAELAKISGMHLEQTHKFVEIIARFGHFPHRNALLGRSSSAEEQAFLSDWAVKGPPKEAPRHAEQAR
jgi:uncharacterized protein (DUF924 family)/glutathione S-transferase